MWPSVNIKMETKLPLSVNWWAKTVFMQIWIIIHFLQHGEFYIYNSLKDLATLKMVWSLISHYLLYPWQYKYVQDTIDFCLFIPRPKGSGDIAMSLGVRRPSVRLSRPRPSVNTFLSALYHEYPLEYFHDTSQLCRTGHDNVSRTRNGNSCYCTFWIISPLVIFLADSCPLCNLNTLWNIFMILHRNVEQVLTICCEQEWQLLLSYFLSYFPLIVLGVIFLADSCPLYN